MIHPPRHHKPDFLIVLVLLVVVAFSVTVTVQYVSDETGPNSNNSIIASR